MQKVWYNVRMNRARPFVKWAGGKSQLLEEIRRNYPVRIERYCEPFVGGGAVLFDVLRSFQPKEVLINDINRELICTYAQIRDDCGALVSLLSAFQDQYRNATLEENRRTFMERRQRYNELKAGGTDAERTEQAALFIFLNKTCFNGLYRVNARGQFNVPFNSARNPLLCDEENLRACSTLLQDVRMTACDYSRCGDFIDAGTFVYLDPPYRPLTRTAAFTAYAEGAFDDEKQQALAGFIRQIDRKGAQFLLSNSDPKNVDAADTFFDDLYAGFHIGRVSASRAINSKGTGRGKVAELLIDNAGQAADFTYPAERAILFNAKTARRIAGERCAK